ncbi:Variant surface glycoprotein [Trypanosoma congolense IL3000]|uniref:Variant surface glycoprotein n=1 Tax=Trypanosoma congolense (strain IL3000) TaxID=1068625 RepID=F9WAA5_TRYCI|nr:Variant surface glycoprotein [Trypanosoma congolense IL3000]
MMNVAKIMTVVGLVVMGVHADVATEKVSSKSGFDLLCEVMKLATGVWHAVGSNYEEFTDDKEEKKLNKNIDQLFFGERESEDGVGNLYLPSHFEGARPERSSLCGSKKGYNNIPPPYKSLASALLCLCVGAKGDNSNLCGLTDVGEVTWPDGDTSGRVKNVFDKVWGDYSIGGVREKCEAGDTSIENLEETKENLTAIIKELDTTLTNQDGMLCPEVNKCQSEPVSVNVTRKPAWMPTLKEISNHIPIILKSRREKPLIDPVTGPAGTTTNEYASELVPPTEPAPAPAWSKVQEEAPKQEIRKAPEEKSKPKQEQKKHTELQQSKEEDHNQIPELNETSGSFLKRQKWPLWAALLI